MLETIIFSFSNFSLAIDETDDVSQISQHTVFIDGFDEVSNITEELLCFRVTKNTITNEDILQESTMMLIA